MSCSAFRSIRTAVLSGINLARRLSSAREIPRLACFSTHPARCTVKEPRKRWSQALLAPPARLFPLSYRDRTLVCRRRVDRCREIARCDEGRSAHDSPTNQETCPSVCFRCEMCTLAGISGRPTEGVARGDVPPQDGDDRFGATRDPSLEVRRHGTDSAVEETSVRLPVMTETREFTDRQRAAAAARSPLRRVRPHFAC